MRLLLADALLVLSLLFVRPVASGDWPARLWLHGLLLAGCLLAALVGGAGVLACLLGIAAALLPPALLHRVAPRDAAGADATRLGSRRDALLLLGGLLLVALAMRLLPAAPPTLAALPRGLLSAALGILLTALLGACCAGHAAGRTGSLLLAGNGLLLVACQVPGLDLLSLASLLLLQGGLLGLMIRATRAGPAAGDAASAAA